ncbi:hypothetical protein PQR46_32745 [Paraburkholderia sediminicola]|uniref:hypothetical protein n=1 Tax=Paraburkholderia sediminicola TaxID=458836 RepID=UPI0038B8D814
MKFSYRRCMASLLAMVIATGCLAEACHAQTGSSTYNQKDKSLAQPGANSTEAHSAEPSNTQGNRQATGKLTRDQGSRAPTGATHAAPEAGAASGTTGH